eukprot:196877-Hanusia_phi.AAC.1
MGVRVVTLPYPVTNEGRANRGCIDAGVPGYEGVGVLWGGLGLSTERVRIRAVRSDLPGAACHSASSGCSGARPCQVHTDAELAARTKAADTLSRSRGSRIRACSISGTVVYAATTK